MTAMMDKASRPRRILVAIGNVTEARTLLPLVARLKDRAEFHVFLSGESEREEFDSRVRMLDGVHVLRPPGPTTETVKGQFDPYDGSNDHLLQDHIARLLDWCREALAEIKPDIILSGSDRDFRSRVAAMKCAQDAGIPICAMPCSFPAFEISLLERRTGEANTIEADSWIRQKYPAHCVQEASGRWVSFYRRTAYPALDALGLVGGKPWVYGTHWNSTVLAQSQLVADQLIEAGLPAQRVKIVGAMEFDDFANSLRVRQRWRADLKSFFPERLHDKPLIAWSLPQYAEHGMCSLETANEISAQVKAILDRLDLPVLISLHPKMEPEAHSWIWERSDNMVLEQRPLRDWIAAADACLVPAYSSIGAWSAALAIPAVIYDFLELDDIIFDPLEAVHVSKSLTALDRELSEIAEQGEGFEAWQAQARDKADYAGVVDGMALERIADALGIANATQQAPLALDANAL